MLDRWGLSSVPHKLDMLSSTHELEGPEVKVFLSTLETSWGPASERERKREGETEEESGREIWWWLSFIL